MVQYDPDGSGHEIKFKPFSYPDMVHGVDKYKVKKGEVEVGAPKTEAIPSQEANSSLSSQIANVGASDWAFTDMGKTLNKPPIITSFKQPQVKPTQTTNSSSLSQENQQLVSGWNKTHPIIERSRFESIMSGMFNDYGSDATSTNFVNNVFIKNSSGNFVTRQNCSDSDVQYIKEQFTLNGKDYVNGIGSVRINNKDYFFDFDALSDYDL
jgi:hypothetical protein